MRAVYVAVACLMLGAVVASAQDMVTNPPPAVTEVVASGDGMPFPVGEELIYDLYWGFIPVGRTRIVTRWVEQDGRRLLSIRYRTRSNSVIAALYPVDDTIDVLVDPATFLSVRFEKNLNEGRSRTHEITTFDYTNLVARWESLTKGKVREFKIERDTRDIVTFMYHLRGDRFQPGDVKQYRVMADEKVYDLTIKGIEEDEVKLSRFGKVASVLLEPEAQFNGIFVRKGRLFVWVSKDDRFLCTKVVAETPFANVKAFLDQVHGPGDDSWIRVTHETIEKGERDEDPEVEKALQELDQEPESKAEPQAVGTAG